MSRSAISQQIETDKQVNSAFQLGLASIAVVSLLIGLMLVRSALIRPLLELKAIMQRFAQNDLAGAIPSLERHDEIGDMARTIEVFRANALERQKLQASGEAMREEEVQRTLQLEKMTICSIIS